ncbi:MAG: hypothetical protein IKM18_03190 [Clostridia bacterium]|nr:hypothetical protein [Clostridia bacterium]
MKVKTTRENGLLKIDIDGKLYDPLSFKSFRPNPQNISEFYKAGVRLFSVLSSGIICALGVPYSRYGESWIGDGEYDFSSIDRQMDMFVENAPDGYFAPMFQIDTRPWYCEKYPETPNSFQHLSQTAHDERWRRAAADYLKAAIAHCEEKYGDRIYGYFLLGGMTTEWLAHPDKEASHPLKEAAYKKYRNDENATLPTLEEFEKKGPVFLEETEENVLAARRFHAESVADLVLYFASEAQSVIKHEKLLGLYYGYLLELGGEYLFNSGHLAYENVYLSGNIDMVSSPSAYPYRALTDPSAFMVTQKTLDVRDKLYFLEFDHITHVAPTMINEPCEDSTGNGCLKAIPGAKNKCKDQTESINLMWRDFLLCYANGAAMWWFDMFDGWFRSSEMMGAIEKMITIRRDVLSNKMKDSIAEIAVYAEGESMYHVRKNSWLASVCLSDMRRSFAEMGAPYDLYSIADLDRCDSDRYKLIIILDSYDIPSERMQKIRELQEKGVSVLWIYAPDYARDGINDVSKISDAVQMRVSVSDTPYKGLVYNGNTTPNKIAAPYFAIEESDSVNVYARYDDGKVAIASTNDKKNIYAAVPFIPSDILRDIARERGIYIYSDDPKVYTYVNADVISVYNASDGDAKIHVKEDGVYRNLIEGGSYESSDRVLRLPIKPIRAYMLVKE